MALTDEHLVKVKPHFGGGEQRIYRDGRYGLSLVNSPILHSFPFAWEAAVCDYGTAEGKDWHLTYDTPLTNDVEVFDTEAATASFIAVAFKWFAEQRKAEAA